MAHTTWTLRQAESSCASSYCHFIEPALFTWCSQCFLPSSTFSSSVEKQLVTAVTAWCSASGKCFDLRCTRKPSCMLSAHGDGCLAWA